MNVPENIKALLDERGWTVERLAVECQDIGSPLAVGSIRQWLTGRSVPNGQSVIILAKALSCTTDAILMGEPKKAAV